MTDIGITRFGAYVPSLRIGRTTIGAATAWLDPNILGGAKGEKAFCNWDEDTLTMAVEAARDCVGLHYPGTVDAVALASTTAMFFDRSSAALLAEALSLGENIATAEYAGSRRVATNALILAFGAAGSGETLVAASDRRVARPGSPQEMAYGHGAAAVTIGSGERVIARIVASHSNAHDFVDQYRQSESGFDYALEERWVRDEGWLKAVPPAVEAALKKANVRASNVSHTIIPASRAIADAVVKSCGLPATALADTLALTVGDTGASYPLLLLAACLEKAKPGDTVLVTSFGQGCDAIVLQITDAIIPYRQTRGPLDIARRGDLEGNYLKYLAFSGLVAVHSGMRAEHDKRTAHSVAARKHQMLTGLIGGKCSACGTVQFPRTRACVNPACGAFDTQAPYNLRERAAVVKTFTEDWLAYTPSPPLIYGNIQFADGANIMMDMTDVGPGAIKVGMAMRMVFRIKDIDERRDFRRYFWKAVPVKGGDL